MSDLENYQKCAIEIVFGGYFGAFGAMQCIHSHYKIGRRFSMALISLFGVVLLTFALAFRIRMEAVPMDPVVGCLLLLPAIGLGAIVGWVLPRWRASPRSICK